MVIWWRYDGDIMMIWWRKGRRECGEWEWSNQARINHWFTGRWHFLKTLIIIPSCHCCHRHASSCHRPWLIRGTHEFTHHHPAFLRDISFEMSVLCQVRIWREASYPSPIHRNARNAQHLNAPPPKLVHHHSPILYPTHPKSCNHPLTSIPTRRTPGRNLLGI